MIQDDLFGGMSPPPPEPLFEEIILTREEIQRAFDIGTARWEIDKAQNFRNKHGIQDGNGRNGLQRSIEGTLAEIVLERPTGFKSVGALQSPDKGNDVGPFGVKGTQYLNGCLLLRKDAQPWRHYVLVTLEIIPERLWFCGRIIGTLTGKEAMQQRYWGSPNNRPPAFFVPQSDLIPWMKFKQTETYRRLLLWSPGNPNT